MRRPVMQEYNANVEQAHGLYLGLFSNKKPDRREIWLFVETLIRSVKRNWDKLGWVRMLDPWIARNTEYFIFQDDGQEPRADLWEDLPQFSKRPLELCGLIYIHECMAELQERLSSIRSLKGTTDDDKKARILGFFRFYDICGYYTKLFTRENYRPLYGRLKLLELQQHSDLIERTLQNLYFMPKAYIVEDFLTLNIRLFHEFNSQVLHERFFMCERFEQGFPPLSPMRSGSSIVQEDSPPRISMLKSISSDRDYQLCKTFMENEVVYERFGSKQQILRRQAVEFCLVFLLRRCLKIALPSQRELITNSLAILQHPTPNIKKFWRLDPRKEVEHLEKTQPFYKRIYQIYIDVIEYRRKSIADEQVLVKELRNCYYLAYEAGDKGFQIRYGTIRIFKPASQEAYIFVQRSEVAPETPTSENVEVVMPGFINLHTHTKFNFQGKVDFGRRFNYRFEWRGTQYEGKHIIDQASLLKHICTHNRTPKQKLAVNGVGYCETDRNQFRENVKLYSQLQAALAGTTTQFMECQYEKRPYLELIRNTVINNTTSKNVSSNDLYWIWRNERNKEMIAMIWTKDFIKFLQQIVQLEISILREHQRGRVNLHVHLAEGGSDNNVTACQFDNFCYDIICIQHFIRQTRDRLDNFGSGDIKVKVDSKINESQSSSTISAERADKKYRCQLEIIKSIVRSPEDDSFHTDLSLKITEYVTVVQGSIIRDLPVKTLKQLRLTELAQNYKLQSLRGNLLIIHANGFNWSKPLHRYLLETYETNVCISPFSNILLYGELKRFNWRKWIGQEEYRDYWKYLTIGTDWNPSGTENILEETRFLLKQFRANNIQVTPQICRTLLEMMTVNPARVIKVPAGELRDSCLADLWIGSFPTHLLFPQGQFSSNADRLVEYLLRSFSYQERLLQLYSKGKLVYSQIYAPDLQQISLKNELSRWFLNPQGQDDYQFQQYVQRIRDLLTNRFEVTASQLYP